MTRLLADRMMEGLARRLRLAGYDCALPPAVFYTPRAIVDYARSEGRILLTASPATAALGRPEDVLALPEAPLGVQVARVMRQCPIDFLRLALTRCSRDNTPLEEIPFERAAPDLPPRVREAAPQPVRRCPACGRLYWPGTHAARIRRQFKAWTGQDV